MGTLVKSDIFEFWSLPWHALQHRLASGFGAEAPRSPAPGAAAATFGAAAPSVGSSWLARARSGASQVRLTGR
jgi:hypothetical protein